jgi:site-specific DNA recombinase
MGHVNESLPAGVYVRISEDDENEGGGVARQEKDCRKLAARIGWAVADVYSDNDRSAYSGKPRPGYARMLADVREGRIKGILAWHPDRLHRSTRELEDFIDLVEAHSVLVQTDRAGRYDLSTPAGRMQARIIGAVNRAESEHKADRIKRKHVEIAESGKAIGGGHRPYGYERIYDRPDPPHKIVRLVLVPAEAEVVREAARRVLAGEALASVCRDLNRRGVTTTTGGAWSTTTLSRVLASGRIAGWREHIPRGRDETKRVRMGDLVAKGEWPAIVSEADSRRLRTLLADPARRVSPGATGRHLATGLLYCDHCKQRMVGRSKGGTRRRAYMCDGQPGRPGCGRMFIDADGTDQVIAAMAAQALTSAEFRAALEQIHARPGDEDLLAEIAECEAELSELAADLGHRRITRPEWLAARGPIETRMQKAQRQLGASDVPRRLKELPGDRSELQARLLDPEEEASSRRAIIQIAIERVWVRPGLKGRHRFDPDRLDPIWRA